MENHNMCQIPYMVIILLKRAEHLRSFICRITFRFYVIETYLCEENIQHKGTIVKKILSDSFNIFTCKQVLLLSTLNFKKNHFDNYIYRNIFNSSVWRRHLYLHILFWVQEIINFTPPKQNIDDNCEERNCYPGVVSKFM